VRTTVLLRTAKFVGHMVKMIAFTNWLGFKELQPLVGEESLWVPSLTRSS